MKFHRLLAGTAVAALMAGNASALSLSLLERSPRTPGGVNVVLSDSEVVGRMPNPGMSVLLSEESNTADRALAGTFSLRVTTENAIASSDNYLITLNIDNGEFATQVDGTDLVNGSTLFSGTTIEFQGGQTTGRTRTGRVGDSSVSFLSSASDGQTTFSIVFDVVATCRGPLNFTVEFTTEMGTPIEEGRATLPVAAAVCVDTFETTVSTDILAGGVNDSILRAPDFQTLNTAIGSPYGNDSATEANVGTVSIEFDPTGATSGSRQIFPSLLAAEDHLTGGIAGDAADIDTISLTIDLDNTVGVDGVAARAQGGTPTQLNADGVGTIMINPTRIGADVGGVEVDIDGTVTLLPVQPVVTEGTVSYTGTALGLAAEAVLRPNQGLLDRLNYDGEQCGTFDWVGDSTRTRRNVFRITNFANSQSDGIFATMTNSSAGLASTTRPISGRVTVSGREMSFTDVQLTDAFGNYGRADFSFNFIGATNTLDCDRLQSSPVSSVVTAFGNNSRDFGDGDD